MSPTALKVVQHSGLGLEQDLSTAFLTKTCTPWLPKQGSSTKKANQSWDNEEEEYLQYTSLGRKYEKRIHTVCGLRTLLIQRHFSPQGRKFLLPERYNKTLGEALCLRLDIQSYDNQCSCSKKLPASEDPGLHAIMLGSDIPTTIWSFISLTCMVKVRSTNKDNILSFVSFLPLIRRKSNFSVPKLFLWKNKNNHMYILSISCWPKKKKSKFNK